MKIYTVFLNGAMLKGCHDFYVTQFAGVTLIMFVSTQANDEIEIFEHREGMTRHFFFRTNDSKPFKAFLMPLELEEVMES